MLRADRMVMDVLLAVHGRHRRRLDVVIGRGGSVGDDLVGLREHVTEVRPFATRNRDRCAPRSLHLTNAQEHAARILAVVEVERLAADTMTRLFRHVTLVGGVDR